ncbi:MAG: SO2930 family diheme c-type cytochrome [Pirellulales bacterium]
MIRRRQFGGLGGLIASLRGGTCFKLLVLGALVGLGTLAGCARSVDEAGGEPPEKLSDYGLFTGNGSTQEAAAGVIPYDLNTPLFSDYTEKFRFVKLPAGESAKYQSDAAFDFPVGTLIAKTFAYPVDARDPKLGRRLLETRILKREADGWVGLPYVWNAEQTEATLDVAGSFVDAKWIDTAGQERTNNYIIPNANQCKGCHKQGDVMEPLGPKARHLNRDFAYTDGTQNQLAYWSEHGALSGAPDPKDAPRLAVWDDPSTGSLDQRARAWLEINCAHCHNPTGPARNSGLDLLASQHNPTSYGIMKTPVAAGRGTGGREYGIVPGQPDESILMYRILSIDTGIMMPELGKRLIHKEGAELVREWIAAMPSATPPATPASGAQ